MRVYMNVYMFYELLFCMCMYVCVYVFYELLFCMCMYVCVYVLRADLRMCVCVCSV